ncbi:MAG: PaaI family thioesterase, partial [Alphaproteobacteria bacterium]
MGLAFASAEELLDYVETVFPQVRGDFALEHLDERSILLRLHASERHLRPGGTVSGPAMFGLADCCGYLMTLARIGPVPLAVTTSASIDFMRKPPPGDL